jgi:hypothetical protein
MDNYFDMLPKEIINKIMLYNSHPVSDIMKYKMIKYNSYITRWESYTNDDKPMTFSRYTLVRMQLNKTYKRYKFELKEIIF